MSQGYVYQHYPLWITLADGTRLIVDDAEHEARERGVAMPPPAADAAAPPAHQPETVRRPRGRPRLERKP